ncbi:MAG: lipoyl(octanoyl) transferase LipB [Dehalococcoidia bacterium]
MPGRNDACEIDVDRLGTVSYGAGLEWQGAALEAVRAGGRERVALLEHEPVYTLGARAARDSLRVSESALPAPLVVSSRGGDVTFHGPGQLVVYPVLHLGARGLRPGDYVRALEGCAIDAIGALGVHGERWAGRPGVWVRLEGELAKVAAIGVRVQHGVSAHGLAINVSTDLRWFAPIVPWSQDAGVTTLAHVLGRRVDPEEVERVLLAAFARTFNARLVEGMAESKEPVRA